MARSMMVVAATFLPKKQQSTKCGSRRNGSSDSNSNGKGDGDSNNVNSNDDSKEDKDGKEDNGSGSSVPAQQTHIN
jgi:hypothetical protein